MQPPGRHERRGPNRMGGGFPGFGDPFAAFGMSSMFDDDPFNDPFFTRPFESVFGNAGSMFGPSGFFGPSLFPHPGFGTGGRQIAVEPFNSRPEEVRRGVQIEEVPDGHEIHGNTSAASGLEPIVEHPEDDGPESTEVTLYQGDPRAQRSASPNDFPLRGSTSTPRTFSYQSSSVSYGGANGPYFVAHSSRRSGPDGVYEEQHGAKDMNTGRESQKVLHGLGNKGRAVTRKRSSDGREERSETLHNLEKEEIRNFEDQWESQAERVFSRPRSGLSQRLGQSSASKQQTALPSSQSSGRPLSNPAVDTRTVPGHQGAPLNFASTSRPRGSVMSKDGSNVKRVLKEYNVE